MTDAQKTADEQVTSSQDETAQDGTALDAALDDALATPDDSADVPLTEHAPGRRPTGPEQRGTGGSG
jgi:hypothetical protein